MSLENFYRLKVLLIQFFSVALSVIFLFLYEQCNFASVYKNCDELFLQTRKNFHKSGFNKYDYFEKNLTQFFIKCQHFDHQKYSFVEKNAIFAISINQRFCENFSYKLST